MKEEWSGVEWSGVEWRRIGLLNKELAGRSGCSLGCFRPV